MMIISRLTVKTPHILTVYFNYIIYSEEIYSEELTQNVVTQLVNLFFDLAERDNLIKLRGNFGLDQL